MIKENISSKTLDLKTGESIDLLIKSIKDTVYDINLDVQTKGIIINLLIMIIQFLISIVQALINLVYKIIDLVEIINTLVNLIGTLFDLIIELINLIIDIFTPGTLTST
jgi:phage-related protein